MSLPSGWRATAVSDGLEVGPAGRVSLRLEQSERPLPSETELLSALTSEAVRTPTIESDGLFVGARYLLEGADGGRSAFLGVTKAGARTVWCASTRSAEPADLELAVDVCRKVSIGEAP